MSCSIVKGEVDANLNAHTYKVHLPSFELRVTSRCRTYRDMAHRGETQQHLTKQRHVLCQQADRDIMCLLLGLVPKHPQVGVGDAVTLPSMQKAARDLSSRRVPLVRVPLVLGSVAFWCREKRVRVRLGCDVCQGEGVIGQRL